MPYSLECVDHSAGYLTRVISSLLKSNHTIFRAMHNERRDGNLSEQNVSTTGTKPFPARHGRDATA